MLFSEIYGVYFETVETILREASEGTLTAAGMKAIVRDKAFAESFPVIREKLMSEDWPLITKEFETPIDRYPGLPLTTLQKRWLKAILRDPRVRLFEVDDTGLEDVEPLFTPDRFCCFDRFTDGDPFDDEGYIRCFRTLLRAVHTRSAVETVYQTRTGKIDRSIVYPFRLEYSSIDDKFRLIATTTEHIPRSLNLARISSVELMAPVPASEWKQPHFPTKTMTFELSDERLALERVMHQFSYLTKETTRIDDQHYRVKMTYHVDDEMEIVIKLLSFGPVIRVTGPDDLIDRIRGRVRKQISLTEEKE